MEFSEYLYIMLVMSNILNLPFRIDSVQVFPRFLAKCLVCLIWRVKQLI